jgi:hypothetical protein
VPSLGLTFGAQPGPRGGMLVRRVSTLPVFYENPYGVRKILKGIRSLI